MNFVWVLGIETIDEKNLLVIGYCGLFTISGLWKRRKKKAKELLEEGLDVYENFIEKIFKRSSLKYMFEYAKRMRKQSRVEMWLEK